MLVLAIACALVLPSLLAGPGTGPSPDAIAVPPERGLTVVRAAPTAPERTRRSPATPTVQRPQRIAPASPAPARAAPVPVSRPSRGQVTRPVAIRVPGPAPEPEVTPPPAPAPSPSPAPSPAPAPPTREVLVSGPDEAIPPHGRPVEEEDGDARESQKHEPQRNGHEQHEPEKHGQDDDEKGGPKQDRGSRD